MAKEFAEFFRALPFFMITYGTLVLFGVVIYLIAVRRSGGQMTVLELAKHCFPPECYLSRSALMDLILYACQKTYNFFERGVILYASASVFIALLTLAFGDRAAAGGMIEPGTLLTVGCVTLFFVGKEFGDWYAHYLGHKVPVFWELHKVHHSATQLIPLTSLRSHPAEVVTLFTFRTVIAAVPLAVMCYFIDFNMLIFLGYAGLLHKFVVTISLDPLRHSHLRVSLGPFDRLFISPHMHQIHHSKIEQHWDKNFATSLSFIDWAFGTAYRPAKGEEPDYGTGPAEVDARYSTLRGAFLTPLHNIGRIIRGRNLGVDVTPGGSPVDELDAHGA